MLLQWNLDLVENLVAAKCSTKSGFSTISSSICLIKKWSVAQNPPLNRGFPLFWQSTIRGATVLILIRNVLFSVLNYLFYIQQSFYKLINGRPFLVKIYLSTPTLLRHPQFTKAPPNWGWLSKPLGVLYFQWGCHNTSILGELK